MNILLAPHNDDESLFAAYTCLRHKPLVIVCLRSYIEAGWPNGPTYQVRELETTAACEVLGVAHEQWTYRDDEPPWDELRRRIASLTAERIWAPLPEQGGHPHHNEIGAFACQLPNVSWYSTYTHEFGKTTTGTLVVTEPKWQATKRQAMACYPSQSGHPQTQEPFKWPIDEYLS